MLVARSLLSFLVLPLLLAGAPRAAAAQARVILAPEFQKILAEACNELGKRRQMQQKAFGGTPTSGCDPVQSQARFGAWRFVLSTVCLAEGSGNSVSNNAGKAMRYSLGSVIENHGEFVRYTLMTQAFKDTDQPFVQKAIENRLKDISGEFKDVEVQSGMANGAYVLVANHKYNKGTSNGDVVKRLVYLGSQANFLVCDVHEGVDKHRRDTWDDLKGKKLAKLTNDEFVILNPILQEDGYQVKGSNNFWRLSYDDYKVGLINQDSLMTLGIEVKYGNPTNQASAYKTDTLTTEFAAKRRFKKGTMRTSWDNNSKSFWLVADIPYNTLTGREVMDLVKEFYSDYAEDTAKDLKKLIEKNLK